MSNYQQFIGAVQPRPLHRREVKGRQAHDFADPVAQVGVEVEGHASDTCNTSQTAVSGSGHTGRQRAGLPALGSYPGSRHQSRCPSPCGSVGRCRGRPPPGCPPRSAGVPTARRWSDWRPDGQQRLNSKPVVIKQGTLRNVFIHFFLQSWFSPSTTDI